MSIVQREANAGEDPRKLLLCGRCSARNGNCAEAVCARSLQCWTLERALIRQRCAHPTAAHGSATWWLLVGDLGPHRDVSAPLCRPSVSVLGLIPR